MDDDFSIDENLLLEAAENADRYIEHTKPQPKHLECLNAQFGHNQFRPKQWDIIRSIIEDKRDNCVVMPTGHGKSLCFQYPSVYTNGITLVVSPLISLMQDQVFALSVANITATFVGSAQTDRTIEQRIVNGEFRLVYASPEYLSGANGQELVRRLNGKLTLIAVDEAHCVSHWGHDFRTDYRKLGNLRSIAPDVPVLAVTATATPSVRDDICRQLKMRDPQVLCMGFDRPNLEFQVFAKSDDAWSDLRPFITNVRGSIIIYVIRKRDAEEVAGLLLKHGVQCEYYHASVALRKRKEILERFTTDQLQIIVATVAFGMGIDKPDVRLVIHYGPSKNLETYYQEVGRAGRDGFPSKVITFYKNADFALIDWLLNQNVDHKSDQVVKHLQDISKYMRELIMTRKCRRAFLLEYFRSDASHLSHRSDCCDNCRNGNSSMRLEEVYEGVSADGKCDFTEDAFLLLKAFKLTNSVSLAPLLLNGSGDKKLETFKRDELFGKGKLKRKNYWVTLIKQLKNDGLLHMKQLPPPYHSKMVISPLGYEWLTKMPKQRLVLKAIGEMHEFFRLKKTSMVNNNFNIIPNAKEIAPKAILNPIEAAINDRQLEDVLLSIRSELALETSYKPHMVASNAAIQDMVKIRPINIHEFKGALIDGFSLGKIEKFASFFIRGIAKFQSNEFSMESLLQQNPLPSPAKIIINEKHRSLIKLLRNKKSSKQLQTELNVTPEQLLDLFLDAIKMGLPIIRDNLQNTYGCDDSYFDFIKSNIDEEDTPENVLNVKRKCMHEINITDGMIKLVVAFVRVREHLDTLNVPFYDPTANILINAHFLSSRTNNASHQTNPATSTAVNETVSTPNEPKTDVIDDDGFDDLLGSLNDEHFSQPTTSKTNNVTTTTAKLQPFQAGKPHQITTTAMGMPAEVASITPAALNTMKEDTVSAATATNVPPKRVNIMAKSRVVYCDDSDSNSDSNENDSVKAPPPRQMPGWLSKATVTSNQNATKRKRIF